jgi:hypothetical protein
MKAAVESRPHACSGFVGLLLSASFLALVGCAEEQPSSSSRHLLDGWMLESDRIVCSAEKELDFFRLVKSENGIRLDQQIAVGRIDFGPQGYTRSVSFRDPEGNSIGQHGAIRNVRRNTVERRGYVFENRSDYFPVNLDTLGGNDLIVVIRIAKAENSDRIQFGQADSDRVFDYELVCASTKSKEFLYEGIDSVG